MLARLSNIPMTVMAVLGASVILLALLLALAFRGLQRRDPEKKWDAWRSVKSALIFIAGPFPISIAIHLAVLLFLIHEVRQAVAPQLINIHLESEGGGGNGGATPDAQLPSLPDIATPDTAVTGLSLPVPRIVGAENRPDHLHQ